MSSTASPQIVFLDRNTIAPHITIPRPAFDHRWQRYPHTSPEQVVARLRDAQIVINNKVILDEKVLSQLPHLQMISLTATGYDCVDIDYCKAQNIVVSNVRGYAKHTVPEHVFTLLLALRRNLFAYREEVIAGAWSRSDSFCLFHHPVYDLAGSTMVIIGSGSLGQGTAQLAKAFGMQVKFAARKGQSDFDKEKYIAWQDALACADVISLHCPLNAQTRQMIAMPEFMQMTRKPVLINTARGGLVDEKDLLKALEQGLIAGAGFDVAAQEPPPADSPLHEVAKRKDCIVTPHMAWASDGAQQALIHQTIENIEHFMAGTPRHNVWAER